MTAEAVSEMSAAGPGGPAAPVSLAVPTPRSPSPRSPSRGEPPRGEPPPSRMAGAAGPEREPVALDTALVDTMVQGARVVAAAEAAGLAAIAGLALGRQAAARADLLAWRRAHPDHRVARQAWDVAAADCDDSVAGEVADEVAAALRLSRRAARARVDLAVDLLTAAPATLAALQTGVLDLPRARRIVEALVAVHADDPATAARVEAEVLARAGQQTPAQVAASVRRAVLRHARHVAEDASQRAHTERRVGVEHPGDPSGRDAGQASLWVQGRADRVQAAFENLTRAARAHLDTHPGESRTLDQVRADLALTALLTDLRTGRLRTGDTGHHPDPAGDPMGDPDTRDATQVPDPPVTVHLVLPLATLAGGNEPGELLGHGPVPAPLARDLLVRTRPGDHASDGHPVTVLLRQDVTFTRWLTDPRGVVVATPAPTYRPPAGMARAVRARDLTCRFPGCRVTATRCDLDHTVPWPAGDTSFQNLTALCRGHHEGKTHRRWSVTLDPDTAALTWTAPTGHTYTTHPPAWPEGP